MKNSTAQIMGVLNITPNSFSDGGKYFDTTSARSQYDDMWRQGASIVDIGAESTGPQSKPVSLEEERQRLSLLLDSIEIGNRIVSVDTYKSEIALWALQKGVRIINDVSGLRADPKMIEVVSQHDADIVVMYAAGGERFPHATLLNRTYDDILETISSFFRERIAFCQSYGIRADRIILDPGMGSFLSADSEYSWKVVRAARRFVELFPAHRILYGVSRKGFTKEYIQEGVDGRDRLDMVSKCIELELIEAGVHIIRTHNVGMLQSLIALKQRIRSE